MLFPEAMMEAAADRAACRALLAGGSRSFLAASRLLPQRVRDPATALYAFCRVADDAVDGSGASDKATALARLRLRLDRAYDGTPSSTPADRAFADVVSRFAIPRALPEALLEGFAWDVQGRTYEALEDVHAYAARVAGSVGVMMALIMGVRSREALGCAASLGAAMQLTNIARDVGEDAATGRLYLPRAWMRDAGLDPDVWLAAPRFDPRLAGVVQRLLAEADRLYRSADAGIGMLPFGCRPGIRAARTLYAAIGRDVARAGFDSIGRRAHVPAIRKIALVLATFRPRLGARDDQASRAPPAAAALIACVNARSPAERRTIRERVSWVFELFEEVEARRLGSNGLNIDGGFGGAR